MPRQLSVIDKEGKTQKTTHRTRWSFRKNKYKQETGGLSSRFQEETDPFLGYYDKRGILPAPYAFVNLYRIFEESDLLQACVGAMQMNVDGFGYKLNFLGDDLKEKDGKEAKAEKTKIDNFMNQANDVESFSSIRKKLRQDYEVLGNACLEIIRDSSGKLFMVYYIPARSMRMTLKDQEETPYDIKLYRDGKLLTIQYKKQFRKFVQILPGTKKPVYFKEHGDPRPMDWRTGEYKKTSADYQASEIIWFKQEFGGFSYGLPRWIGALMEVLGRRSAQYINYDLFRNQGIPPMLITVSNGVLTDESILELEDTVDSWRGEQVFNRAAVLESSPEGTGIDEQGNAKIDIKFLHEFRKEDLMFERYLDRSEAAIRKTFRLPPLYTGGTEEFNRATAYSSMIVAEQQVFKPEREHFDEIVNVRILQKEMDISKWEYQSAGPQVVGSDEITRGVSSFVNAGALTINYAVELANQAFGLEISKFDYDWANMPLILVQKLLDRGAKLEGLPEVAEQEIQAINPNTPIPPGKEKPGELPPGAVQKKLPPGQSVGPQRQIPPTKEPAKKFEQTVFPILERTDLFSEEEREFYYRLLTIDSALKQRTINESDLVL